MSFILGPLAIIYALLAEAVLATHRSILFGESQVAIPAILFGGFFCSFACMAASMLILFPIALFELNTQPAQITKKSVFSTYFPVPVLLSAVLAIVLWGLGSFDPLQHELVAILLGFYLTASTGLFLLASLLNKYRTNI